MATEQKKEQPEFPIQPPMPDPLTGIQPIGPLEPASEGEVTDEEGWGVAARWLLLALLGILFGVLLYWVYRG